MPTVRTITATVTYDGKIYVIGGARPIFRTVEVYDPATDTWTRKADMPTARWALAADVVVAEAVHAATRRRADAEQHGEVGEDDDVLHSRQRRRSTRYSGGSPTRDHTLGGLHALTTSQLSLPTLRK